MIRRVGRPRTASLETGELKATITNDDGTHDYQRSYNNE